jgi:hypothetical protein
MLGSGLSSVGSVGGRLRGIMIVRGMKSFMLGDRWMILVFLEKMLESWEKDLYTIVNQRKDFNPI